MRQAGMLIMGLVVVAALGSVGWAESVSVQLEKGIFQEETAGDLDAAMKIYREITRQNEANRKYVAQAWYRLGMCHLKKGQKQEAAAVFEKVVRLHPEQTELVNQARVALGKLDKAAPVPPTFGPVRERVINGLVGGKGNEGLALESGKQFNLAPEFGENSAKPLREWIESRGIDLFADCPKKSIWVLRAGGLGLTKLPNDRWNDMKAAAVAGKVDIPEFGVEVLERQGFPMREEQQLPVTFAFKTRAGRTGLMQIVALGKNPRSITIRYKLVERTELGVLGEWTSVELGGISDGDLKEVGYVFKEDGTFTVVGTMSDGTVEGYNGTYKVLPSALEMTIPGKGTEQLPYTLSGDSLTVRDPKNDSWVKCRRKRAAGQGAATDSSATEGPANR